MSGTIRLTGTYEIPKWKLGEKYNRFHHKTANNISKDMTHSRSCRSLTKSAPFHPYREIVSMETLIRYLPVLWQNHLRHFMVEMQITVCGEVRVVQLTGPEIKSMKKHRENSELQQRLQAARFGKQVTPM
ncbi:hypothetical protein Tco_0642223 [Tanacetum coccineum]